MQPKPFELVTQFQPAGDQPQAIEKLVRGVEQGMKDQSAERLYRLKQQIRSPTKFWLLQTRTNQARQ